MKIPSTIIEKAREGGYENWTNTDTEMLLDPTFFQSLGKSLGWETTNDCWGCGYDEGQTYGTPGWVINFHHFIDSVIKGKSIDEFFNKLIK